MTRISLVHVSQLLAPSHCYLCGTCNEKRKYVDFGMQVEFYGAVYFCNECFANAATAVDYVHVDGLNSLEEQLENLTASYCNAMAEVRVMRNVVAAILATDLGSNSDATSIADRIFSHVQSLSKENVPASSKPMESNSDIDKSSGVEGPKRLRSDPKNPAK